MIIKNFASRVWYRISHPIYVLMSRLPHDCSKWEISLGNEKRGVVMCDKCAIILYSYGEETKKSVKKRVYLSDTATPKGIDMSDYDVYE
jgi:hypothetical protein